MIRFSTKELSPQEIREMEERDAEAAASPAQGKKQNAFAFLLEEKKIKKEDLNDDQMEFLKKMEARRRANGDIELYGPGKNDAGVVISQDGSVGIGNVKMDSPEGIDALLEGAAVVKTIAPDKTYAIYGENENDLMMVDYASRLAGVKVGNPSDKKLEDVNPALAKQMKDAWEKMNGAKLAAPQPAADPQKAPMKFSDPTAYPTTTYTMDGARAVIGRIDGERGIKTYAFDETTMANSKVAQFLAGKDANNLDTGALKKYVERLKEEGYEFTAHDKALVKGLQSEIQPTATLTLRDYREPDFGPGPVGYDFKGAKERWLSRIDNARDNWHDLEGVSKAIGNPPDPKADTVPKEKLFESLKMSLTAPDEWKTFDPDAPKPSGEMHVEINPKLLEPLKELNERWEYRVVQRQEESSKLSIAEGERGQISRSGLKSPVPDGLSCKFDGCAIGSNPGAPAAPQLTAGLDTEELKRKRSPAAQANEFG